MRSPVKVIALKSDHTIFIAAIARHSVAKTTGPAVRASLSATRAQIEFQSGRTLMLRSYLPSWMKEGSTELALEVLSALGLAISAIWYVM